MAGQWFAPHYAVPELKTCGPVGADILAAGNSSAPRISQLLPGEDFAVVETSGDWAWGYSAHDHYVGYVPAAALSEARAPTHRVTGSALLFAEPSSHSRVISALPIGARLTGVVEGEFLAVSGGFVPLMQLETLPGQKVRPTEVAERLRGTPYLWGGRGLGGIDCSGLVQIAFGLAGVDLPRDSDQQMRCGREVTDGEAIAGDLLFFPDHVALALDPETVIHASGHWMAVRSEPRAALIERLGQSLAVRRVLS